MPLKFANAIFQYEYSGKIPGTFFDGKAAGSKGKGRQYDGKGVDVKGKGKTKNMQDSATGMSATGTATGPFLFEGSKKLTPSFAAAADSPFAMTSATSQMPAAPPFPLSSSNVAAGISNSSGSNIAGGLAPDPWAEWHMQRPAGMMSFGKPAPQGNIFSMQPQTQQGAPGDGMIGQQFSKWG